MLDPGRYTYAEQAPNLRHWFKGTAAHNTVVVDGLDQTPYRRGKPRKGTIARGRLLERHGAPGLDVVVGEATSPSTTPSTAAGSRSSSDEYWVIEDRLAGRAPHRYDLRFHLAPDAEGRVAVERRDGSSVVRAPGVALVVVGDAAPVVEPGWTSPDYGIRHAAPVVSIVAEAPPTRRSRPSCSRCPTARRCRTSRCARARRRPRSRSRARASPTRSAGRGAASRSTSARCAAGRPPGGCAAAPRGRCGVRAAGVGGGPVWAGWDEGRGMSAGREGDL